MSTKEVLKEAIKAVKREWKWILLEGKFVEDLKKSIEKKDIKKARKFERRAARAERRLHHFEERVLAFIEQLRVAFPEWDEPLAQTEKQLKISLSP